MDGLDMLISQHNMVNNLFQQFEQGGNSAEFTNLFMSLNQALNLHCIIEEQILYPMMQNYPELASMVTDNYDQHAEAKMLLTKLEGMDNTSAEWGQMMTQLMHAVQQHVQLEETQEFPKIRQAFGTEQLNQLGQQLQQAMDKGITANTLYAATQALGSRAQTATATGSDINLTSTNTNRTAMPDPNLRDINSNPSQYAG